MFRENREVDSSSHDGGSEWVWGSGSQAELVMEKSRENIDARWKLVYDFGSFQGCRCFVEEVRESSSVCAASKVIVKSAEDNMTAHRADPSEHEQQFA